MKDLARDKDALSSAPSPVYGEADVMIRYRCLDLLWKPVGCVVRFILVHHPVRGTIFLISSDLTLEPLEIVQLYGYRFKIEAGFRQAVHALASYGYHFWMMAMKPLHRGDGDQHLHHASDAYRDGVRRKVLAYHRYLRWWARGLPMVPGLSRWRPR